MIYNSEQNFLFVAVPKTGTTKIENYLNDHFYKTNVHISWPSEESGERPFHKHSTSIELEREFPDYSKFYKFAFVRNPYDVVVSWFSYLTKSLNKPSKHLKDLHKSRYGERYMSGDFKDFCDYAPPWVFANCYSFIMDRYGDVGVDYIGRYENFANDFEEVCAHLRIPPPSADKENSSGHAHYTTYYDDYTRDLVSRKFALDLKIFDYYFE